MMDYQRQKKSLGVLLLMLLAVALLFKKQCDTDPLQQAIDDFNVIVEIPKLKTVVTTQVVDIQTLEPLQKPVTLTFEGPNANDIIDTYSDPISDMNIKKGIASFGIDSSIVPTKGNPVQFKIRAAADGYYTSTKTVNIQKNNSSQTVIKLTPIEPTKEVPGSEGIRDQSVRTNQNGVLEEELSLETPLIDGSEIQAWFNMEKGVIPMTSDRNPLIGRLTIEMRVFDSQQGQQALTEELLTAQNGVRRSLIGAIHLKVSDENGNVAAGFSTDSIAISTNNSLSTSLFKAKNRNQKGGQTAQNEGAGVGAGIGLGTGLGIGGGIGVATGVAVGGMVIGVSAIESGGNDGYTPTTTTLYGEGEEEGLAIAIDTVYKDIDASEGLMFVFYMKGDNFTPKTLDAQITISSSEAATLINPRLAGWGLNIAGSDFDVPAGDTTLAIKDLLGIGEQAVDIIQSEEVDYGFYVENEAGELVSVTIPDPTSGSYSIELANPSNVKNYYLQATVSCPADHVFDPQFSGSGVDGLCLLYKPTGSVRTYKQVPASYIDSDITASQISFYTNTPLTLMENVSYTFKTVFDTKSSSADYTTPLGSDSIDISVDPDIIGLKCVEQR